MKQLIFIKFLLITVSILGQDNFVLIGPPGGGKGTFSLFMKEKYGYYQICPGDRLRMHIKNETELGKAIKPIVERGDDIDESIVFKIVDDEVSECLNSGKNFIIDGFPRSVSSLNFIVELFKKKNITATIIHFKIDDATCLKRINNRLSCLNCLSVFNMLTKKPKVDMVCDSCGDPLEIRIDNTTQNTLKRLKYYRKNIEPLIELVNNDYKMFSFNSDVPLNECINIYENLILSSGNK